MLTEHSLQISPLPRLVRGNRGSKGIGPAGNLCFPRIRQRRSQRTGLGAARVTPPPEQGSESFFRHGVPGLASSEPLPPPFCRAQGGGSSEAGHRSLLGTTQTWVLGSKCISVGPGGVGAAGCFTGVNVMWRAFGTPHVVLQNRAHEGRTVSSLLPRNRVSLKVPF